MDILSRLDEARRTTNVLEHPFYERWSAGALNPAELALYAAEYRHAVIALAAASSGAAELAADAPHAPALHRHAAEETSHVALWEEFERALPSPATNTSTSPDTSALPTTAVSSTGPTGEEAGTPLAETPLRETRSRPRLPETAACAQAWTAGEDLLEHLAVLYAIEAGQPEISQTKLEGLVEHYGYAPDAPATEYFRLHERLDVEHAQQAGGLIQGLLAELSEAEAESAAQRMTRRAQGALRGNWLLLDGVERAAADA